MQHTANTLCNHTFTTQDIGTDNMRLLGTINELAGAIEECQSQLSSDVSLEIQTAAQLQAVQANINRLADRIGMVMARLARLEQVVEGLTATGVR